MSKPPIKALGYALAAPTGTFIFVSAELEYSEHVWLIGLGYPRDEDIAEQIETPITQGYRVVRVRITEIPRYWEKY